MNLPVEFCDNHVPELHANNVKIQMIGETDRLPKPTFEALKKQRNHQEQYGLDSQFCA